LHTELIRSDATHSGVDCRVNQFSMAFI